MGEKHFIDEYEREKQEAKATQRVRERASQRRGTDNDPVRYKYAQQGLSRECELLASTTKGARNHQLNVAAMKMAQLVAGGWLDQSEVDAALEDACRTNGYIQEDGIRSFRKTLKSGTEKGLTEPRDLSEVGTLGIREYIAMPAPVLIDMAQVEEIEDGFWRKRKSLWLIYQAALARMSPPWGVLGYCAAMALTLAPPDLQLPGIIGGNGSLNLFVALASRSGGGKSSSHAVAEWLIAGSATVPQRNVGSGEGMIDAYRRPKSDEEPGNYTAWLFNADEIDAFTAHGSRSGSTLLPMLRTAFMGGTLGASTKASNHFQLAAHSYRMTLVIGAQPARASTILDDVHGGTAQRFMWFPADDTRIKADRPALPDERLEVPTELTSDWFRYASDSNTIALPRGVEDEVLRARERVAQGRADPMDSHKMFCREKFAYAMALIDGRDVMNREDWDLSGVAMKVSDYTRQWVAQGQEDAQREDAEKYGRTQGYAAAEAERTKTASQSASLTRVMNNLVKHIKESGADGISQRDLQNKIANRDRDLVPAALERIHQQDIAIRDEKRWVLVDEQTF